MKRKNLVFFTCFLLISSGVLYFLYPRPSSEKEIRHELPTQKTKSLKSTSFSPTFPISDQPEKFDEDDVKTQLENIKKFCTEEYPQYRDFFPSVEKLDSILQDGDLSQVWLNLHLKDEDNQVWRLRRFLDDGPNGGVEQVVLYKEDETGFPKIVETSEDNKQSSAPEIFEKHLSVGEPIFTDEAYSLVRDGVDYFFELTNGQITRIDISSSQHHINCQVPH